MAGTPANAINESSSSGLVNFNGTASFATTPLTQFNVLSGASANTVNNIAPSTAGFVLTSQGAAAQPIFQNNMPMTGFATWGGAGNYFDDTTLGSFTILRPGTGFINNVAVSWTAPQTVTGLTAGTCWNIFIDSTGTIGKADAANNTSFFTTEIQLFDCLRNSTSPTNQQITVKENHSYQFPAYVAQYEDAIIGTVFALQDAFSAITLNGTQKIQINGTSTIYDSSLATTVPDSGGAAVVFNQYYTLGSGKWALNTASDTFTGQYNNAGTVTALGVNKFGVYRLYVSKDNLNSTTPVYFAVLDTQQYNNSSQALAAVNGNTAASATNELAALEMAQLGFIIYGQTANAITNVIVSVSGVTTSVNITTTPITTTQFDVLVGGANNTIVSVGPGTAGQVLQSGGNAANPAYSTPTYPSASGTAGKVVISDGTNNVYSTPTFPNASATLNKIIKSDGTNWIASTETYAAPGTSGNVMTSDGTNWTSSAAPGGGILVASGQLTNSQIKNLHGTPVQAIAAPGSGKVIQIITAAGSLNYGGSNAFTAAASQLIGLYYGTTLAAGSILRNTPLIATSSQYQNNDVPGFFSGTALSNVSNTVLNLYNPIATEISGNAANNNTINYIIEYKILTIP